MEGSSNNRQEVLGMQVFHCTDCSKPLRPPVYECPNGRSICRRCRHKILQIERAATKRSRSMDHVVNKLFVSCKHGCAKKIKYYQKERHECCCPVGPCACPVTGCSFVAQTAALFRHLTSLHGMPSVDIEYFVPFQLRVEPGTHVLRGRYSRLFLLDVEPVAPESLDHVVSLTCVRPCRIGCSVCFSSLDGHFQVSKFNIGPNWAPKQRLCAVLMPNVTGGETPVVLTITIDAVCGGNNDDDEDSSDGEGDDDEEEEDEDEEEQEEEKEKEEEEEKDDEEEDNDEVQEED